MVMIAVTIFLNKKVKFQNMNIFIFKSNINCDCKKIRLSECLSKIDEIEYWSVDMEDCDKVIRIVTSNSSISQLENQILKSGLMISELPD